MDKRSKNILYLFGFFLLTIIVIEVSRPQPVNWKPSYTAFDKIPFGSYILHREISDVLNTENITTITESPFTFLTEKSDFPDKKAVYFFVNNYLYFDEEESHALLDFAAQGNIVFLSAQYLGGEIADSLKAGTFTDHNFMEKEVTAKFYTPSFAKDSAVFKRGVYKSYFNKIDTLNAVALGYYVKDKTQNEDKNNDYEVNIDEEINFIKMPYGEGFIYVHTLPEAFSNYYLLSGNHKYTAQALSYIDAENIYWDDYKKSGRRIVESPMRFVLNEVPLKWAYYILMSGLLLFVVFKGKREQRIIPVVKPLENTSVEFTKTIGDLYFQHKDYGNIIAKKITYFLERIRSRYFLDTNRLDDDFAEKLALKSGNNEEETKNLIQVIKVMRGKTWHTGQDLITLNKEIEKFNF